MCKKNILRLPRIQLDKTEKKSRNITKQIPQGAWLRRKYLSKARVKHFTLSCDFPSPAFGIVCSYKTGYTTGRNNGEKKKFNNRPATMRIIRAKVLSLSGNGIHRLNLTGGTALLTASYLTLTTTSPRPAVFQ